MKLKFWRSKLSINTENPKENRYKNTFSEGQILKLSDLNEYGKEHNKCF
jgi:hypothetical protein